MRICVPAVLTGSAFPTVSTVKYLIVWTPSWSSRMLVPCEDDGVGVEPSIV